MEEHIEQRPFLLYIGNEFSRILSVSQDLVQGPNWEQWTRKSGRKTV